jgi:hypothetical protein
VRALGVVALALALGGCVHDAVLENDVRTAVWKSRTLATATDLSLGYAALSAQLVELEALYQRSPNDERVRALLERGYLLMARGFIELRRLRAWAASDAAQVEQERQLASDAEGRARYYAGKSSASAPFPLDQALAGAKTACERHDRAGYERELNALLAKPAPEPEARLEHVLAKQLAAAWLTPNVAARCRFGP